MNLAYDPAMTAYFVEQIGKGRILAEGKDIALLGYGSMVQNCLKAHSLLSKLGIEVTVADARFCKPLDINLIRQLCENHAFLITVEEGSIGGFGSHVAQFIALDGQLDGKIKVIVFYHLVVICLYSLMDNLNILVEVISYCICELDGMGFITIIIMNLTELLSWD